MQAVHFTPLTTAYDTSVPITGANSPATAPIDRITPVGDPTYSADSRPFI